MRITRLQITDMRRYRDLDVTLAPGLTVVRGPNEAGKTTIQRALELVLTRKATSASADLEGLRPWDADPDARPVIAIDFEQEDEDRIRQGHLEKAFRGPKGHVRLDIDGETTTDPARADELVAEITGLPTESFFRSTASIRHHEVNDLARDEAALRDRLQASISGADRGTSRAKKKLNGALGDLNARGMKNPGRIKVAEEAVSQAQSAFEIGEGALAQLEKDRAVLVGARDRRADADALLAERRAMLEKARQAERLIAERDAAQERFERYRNAVAVRDEIASLEDSHPSANALPVLRQIVLRLRNAEARIRELRAMLSDEVRVHYELGVPEPTWLPIAVFAVALMLVGVVSAIASELRVIVVPLALPLGIVAIFVGIFVALFAFRQRGAASVFQRQKQMRDVDIDRRLRGRSQLEEELRLVESDTAQQLEAIDLPDLAAAEDLLNLEEDHVSRIDVLTGQLEGLVGREPSERLPELRDHAALEIEQKAHAIEAIGPIAREPRARERLEVEVRDAETELERVRDDEANSRARLEANPVDAEEVAAYAETLAVGKEQLALLRRRARVYETTLREIERAEQATMRTATRFLEKHMVSDIERVTGGRYRRVRVDDQTLDIAVMAPEKRDWVDVTTLSQGTLDIIYLAARLGLVRLVTGDRRPPLIFDDPFVTLDDGRAARALELLKDISRDFQVIYLTTSDRYDGAADAVVELPAPSDVDDFAEAEPAFADV
jgi:DNA repair exonuclease SbcCD ATPase subunit